MSDKASRWLDLVAFLLDHRFPVTREAIFRKVGGYRRADETARRKFERDKDELRALGVDIETVPLPNVASDEPGTGYRLKPRSTYLPYLELSDEPSERPYPGLGRLTLTSEELGALDRATRALAEQSGTPFAAAAASARRKLSFDLPLTSDIAERILSLPIPEHARQALAILQDAVIERAAVSCQYFTMSRRTEAERELEPWGLLFQWGRWYCVARARDRDEPRLFRVDRMRNVQRLPGAAPHFTLPDDFHVRTFAGRSPWEFGTGPITTAVVRFAFPESRWVVNSGVGRVMREEDDRSLIIAFDVRDQDAFLRWLLPFGRQAEVEQPAAIRNALAALRADVAAMYAEAEA
ncbi:MAG TPA: WYL domain-containing protein [Gemmatimonadaceae bacterium]